MKSHLSEEQISEWIAGMRGEEAGCHLSGCPECAAEVQRTRKALLLFHDSGFQCADYWRQQPAGRGPGVGRWASVAVAIAAMVLAIIVTLHHSPVREAQPIPQTRQEVFLHIPYVVPPAPYERTEVVRMDVPVAALIAAGLRMDAPAADSISADVVVGQDGRPLAVGFPENKK